MRVLHLIKTGFGASWALRQIKHLIDFGVDVHVVFSEEGPMVARFEALGAKVYYAKCDIARVSLFGFCRALREFSQLVKTISPDIVHSHFVGTTIFARIALGFSSNIPRVFQVPGPLHLERFLTRHLELITANSLDHWIATCELTRQIYLDNGVSAENLYLSYYGTETGDFVRNDKPTDLKEILGFSDTTKVVGMVAFMYPPRKWLGQSTGIKGHEDLIDALRILIDEGRDVVGVFVGGAWGGATWYEDRVRKYGRKVLGDRAVFLGNRSDVADLYQVFDAAVHPSHSENVGGALESLLLEVPTVTTNVGGFPDVLKHEVTGLLSPPRDPHALAVNISRILDDPECAKKMALAGSILCRSLFDVNRTAQEVFSVYKDIVGKF